MTQYDNNMTGALFKNDKGDNPKRPDYRGSAEVNGQQFWLSAWLKKSKDGKPFMSLAFEAKDEKPVADRGRQDAADDFDDDVPF